MTVDVFGVRHHGPGSARAVRAALDELRPTCVLIEGAPELDALVGLARRARHGAAGGRARSTPWTSRAGRRSTRWPRSRPSGWRCAGRCAPACRCASPTCPRPTPSPWPTRPATPRASRTPTRTGRTTGRPGRPSGPTRSARWPRPPATTTPSAGGRTSSSTALRHGGRALRRGRRGDGARPGGGRAAGRRPRRPRATPAARRRCAGCSARRSRPRHERGWRSCAAPGTRPRCSRPTSHPSTRDNALLAGLPKVKVAATWVPWTSAGSAPPSGYGAGVDSPGWYHHLFDHRTATRRPRGLARWLVRAARALRDESLDASPARGRGRAAGRRAAACGPARPGSPR